jgi:hypothetical protein
MNSLSVRLTSLAMLALLALLADGFEARARAELVLSGLFCRKGFCVALGF